MSSHSRLGKGLGSLFPELPQEKQVVAGDESAVDGLATNRSPESQQGDESHDVSRETSISADSDSHVANSSETSGSSRRSKRPAMPSLIDSVHPADLFFQSTSVQRGDQAGDSGQDTQATNQVSDAVSSEQESETDQNLTDSNVPRNRENEANGDHGTETSNSVTISEVNTIDGAYYADLRIADISANEHQPRTIFDEDELRELAESIKSVGVLEPIVVRKRDDWVSPFELVMGERRLRAATMAGLETIPAIVRTTADNDMLREALLENIHRVQLNPLEEAAAYQQMIDDFHITQNELAQSVSKSRSQITNTLRLMQLPPAVQKKVASGVLSAGHARALLGLTDENQIEPLANRIIAEGLSVRSTEELVSLKNGTQTKQRRQKKANPWTDSEEVHSLENHFETKVEIRGTRQKGTIQISFASEEDLQRILGLMGSGVPDQSQSEWV